ncbi:hypothetical protein [Chryseobacterium sp. ERMR1:04]|uniref:hypothetical protein n=1 Tax=Chryseobacterium sp. ERMR1:04 TaxID=1705393 RepID=UPI0009EBF2F7|nr:hypothetical protein [Chryseobacterium sp. ERMR1:04]
MDEQITRREAIDKLATLINPATLSDDQEKEHKETLKNEGQTHLEDPTTKHPQPPLTNSSSRFPD